MNLGGFIISPSIKRDIGILGAHRAAETMAEPLQSREIEIAVLGAHRATETIVEESMTGKTAQTDSDLEVPLGEVLPLRIAMNPKLFEAARSGDKRILDELLRQEDFSFGASMGEMEITIPEDPATQKDTSCLLGVTLGGNTALHIVASRGYLELAKEICHRERSLLAASNVRLDTPLHCAARAGHDNIVSLIIRFAKKGGKIEVQSLLRATNMDEANALHEAAKYNHVSVANVLIKVDTGLASMRNSVGMSPLYLAIVTRSLDVAKALLRSSSWENASPATYVGPNKKTVLHVAVLLSREITEDILQRKPKLAKRVDSSGRIPLHYVASDGDHDTVKLLLKHDPSTAHVSDAKGSFSIHIAASMGNILIVDQILQECPETDELLDKEGKNFLHVAFQRRRLDVVKKIISMRPDLRKLLNDQDNKGNTPLHTVVKNGDPRSVYFLLRDKATLINLPNHDGFTPFDLACTKLDTGLRFRMNAELCIASCLALTKAMPGPRELHDLESGELSSDEAKEKPSGNDNFKEKSSSNEAKETKKDLDLSKNLGIASLLIATVTFAAGFTVPGGYIADDHPGRGTAVLAKEYPFKVFLISDAFALICSIIATCCLMYVGTSTVDRYTRRRALYWAMNCLWVAFGGISTAFAMGIYVVLAPNYRRIGILLCFIALVTPLLAHTMAHYNLWGLVKTVVIRCRCVYLIWPKTHPRVQKRLGSKLLHWRVIIRSLLRILLGYVIFFLLAML